MGNRLMNREPPIDDGTVWNKSDVDAKSNWSGHNTEAVTLRREGGNEHPRRQ